MQIVIAFQPTIGGGGVATVLGDYPGQAVFWELVSFDPLTNEEGVALGSLEYDHTKTDASSSSTNLYMAPTNPADAGKIDRVKVRWGSA